MLSEIKFSKREEEVLKLVQSAAADLDVPVYAVGGFPRDKILGREITDIDIVCVGNGIALAKRVTEYLDFKPRVNVFKNFGTAMINLGDIELEFVGARKESYRRDSRKPIVENGTLQDDQNRRDFTINAMGINLSETEFGTFVDPFGGLEDLSNQLIKTPLDPDITFSDDPLRMLRAIRFASQLQFKIDPITFESITRNASRLKIISAERISTELNKIILSKKPSVGFKLLFDSKLLHEFFPEMVRLQGVDFEQGLGHKDNFYHTLEVLDNVAKVSNDLWIRWSAILHDIAKPPTKRFEDGIGWTFHGHEVLGARWVPKIFKRLKLPLDDKMKFVQKLVRMHLRPIGLADEIVTDSAIRRLLFDAGPDLEDLLTLCRADITSKNQNKVERYLKNYDILVQKIEDVEARDQIRNWQPPITGDIIMKTFNIPPSRTVGVIKDAIKDAILDGDIANEYDAAHQFMIAKWKELELQKEV